MSRLKALFLVLLTVLVITVLSAGTLAAYNKSFELTGTIRAARMVFQVNGSGEETRSLSNQLSLGDHKLEPGGKTTLNIVIDTTGTEVVLDVALKVDLSGDKLPPGLSVQVDDESIDPYGTGSVSSDYRMNGDSASRKEVPVVVSWKATPEALKALYKSSREFTLDLSATVTATQAA